MYDEVQLFDPLPSGRSGDKLFKKFKLRDMSVKLGDTVCVANNDVDDPLSLLTCVVGTLKEISEHTSKGKPTTYCGIIEMFRRPDNLPLHMDHGSIHPDMDVIRTSEELEINLDDILCTCRVIEAHLHDDPDEIIKNQETLCPGVRFYVCRYSLHLEDPMCVDLVPVKRTQRLRSLPGTPEASPQRKSRSAFNSATKLERHTHQGKITPLKIKEEESKRLQSSMKNLVKVVSPNINLKMDTLGGCSNFEELFDALENADPLTSEEEPEQEKPKLAQKSVTKSLSAAKNVLSESVIYNSRTSSPRIAGRRCTAQDERSVEGDNEGCKENFTRGKSTPSKSNVSSNPCSGLVSPLTPSQMYGSASKLPRSTHISPIKGSARRCLDSSLVFDENPPISQLQHHINVPSKNAECVEGDSDEEIFEVTKTKNKSFIANPAKSDDDDDDDDDDRPESKASWVSELVDEPLINKEGRCTTPIKLSLKRVPASKVTRKGNERIATPSGTRTSRSTRCDKDLFEPDMPVKGHATPSSTRTPRSTRCNKNLSEDNQELLSGMSSKGCATPSSTRTPRSTRRNINLSEDNLELLAGMMRKGCATPSSTRTPRSTRCNKNLSEDNQELLSGMSSKGCATPSSTRTPCSTRRNINLSEDNLESLAGGSSKGCATPSRTRSISSTSCNKNLAEDDSELNSNKCKTPSHRSTRSARKSILTTEYGNSVDEPKTPSRTRSAKKRQNAHYIDDDDDDYDGGDSKPKTPSSKRNRPLTNCENTSVSPPQSGTPIAYRIKTPVRTVGRTPGAKTPRKTPGKTPGKTPSKVRRSLAPAMPARSSMAPIPQTGLEQARANLHVSAVPASLPCREMEFQNIYCFVEGKIQDSAGGCMYISGMPGTGKTATVHAVVRTLQEEVKAGEIPNFQYIEVNGLRLTEPRQVYVQILLQLTGEKCAAQQAQDILAKRFTSGKKKDKTVVLLVDEVDMLRNRRQDVVYNLFDWPSKPHSRLVVLTIANTMDLPERLLMGRVTSRLGLTRLTFQPYTYKQLQEIVSARLEGTKSFNPDAVQLVSRKVAAVSGDARRALDICRRATELVEEGNPVTMAIVDKTLNLMMNSASIKAIKACSKLEKLFLQAVVAENQRTGIEETTFIAVYRQFLSLCAFSSIPALNVSEAMALLNRLGSSRLLLTEHSRADVSQSVCLNVSTDDIHYAISQPVVG